MRIRRRSIAGTLYSSSSSDKAVSSTCTDREEEEKEEEEEEERRRAKEFVLPVEVGGGDRIAGIQKRRSHNWRNALFQGKAVQVRGGGDKSNYGFNGIGRGNLGDNLGLLPSEGSSVEQEITQQELPKSGRSEKCLMWEKEKPPSDESTVMKNRRKLDYITKCHVIKHINASSKDSIQRDESKTKCKARGDDNDEDIYMHAGSQCRRRNGRGWRCSERTLVGYHLCEHHLGKARLKSINSSNTKGGETSVTLNNKGIKFKELHLIHAAAGARKTELQ